ncbi:MAG: hypothetical protein RIR26_2294, partial [Pseudomonadota bacterium]
FQSAQTRTLSLHESTTLDFKTWCEAYQLKNCSVEADDSIPTDQWRAGVDVFAELMDSLTGIQLTRADFDRKTVQELFSTFGASSTLSFVSKIPWNILRKEDDALVLENSMDNAVAIFNGLRLIGKKKVVAHFVGKQLISISGLQIADALGGNLEDVVRLDLSQPSRMTLQTSQTRIEGIPVQFFQVPGFQQPPTLTPSAAFTAIANVVLEPGFDWKRNLQIMLKGSNLRNIYSIISPFIPQGPADETTRKIVENTDTLMVGGASSNILLSMQMRNPLKCTLNIQNVPVLGSVDFEINFLAGFGLADLHRVKTDGVRTNVYGVSTSIGRIEFVDVDSKQLSLKIGVVTVPIEFKPSAPSGRGPRLDNVQCQ